MQSTAPRSRQLAEGIGGEGDEANVVPDTQANPIVLSPKNKVSKADQELSALRECEEIYVRPNPYEPGTPHYVLFKILNTVHSPHSIEALLERAINDKSLKTNLDSFYRCADEIFGNEVMLPTDEYELDEFLSTTNFHSKFEDLFSDKPIPFSAEVTWNIVKKMLVPKLASYGEKITLKAFITEIEDVLKSSQIKFGKNYTRIALQTLANIESIYAGIPSNARAHSKAEAKQQLIKQLSLKTELPYVNTLNSEVVCPFFHTLKDFPEVGKQMGKEMLKRSSEKEWDSHEQMDVLVVELNGQSGLKRLVTNPWFIKKMFEKGSKHPVIVALYDMYRRTNNIYRRGMQYLSCGVDEDQRREGRVLIERARAIAKEIAKKVVVIECNLTTGDIRQNIKAVMKLQEKIMGVEITAEEDRVSELDWRLDAEREILEAHRENNQNPES